MSRNAEPQLWPKPRRRLFPVYWVAAVLFLWLLLQLSPLTRDFKVIATQVATGAILVGLVGWYLVQGRAGRLVKALIAGATLAVPLTVFATVQLVNDGDGRLVGWRFRWTPAPDQRLALPPKAAADDTPATDSEVDELAEYPAFLGGRLWAEVEGVTLADDWQANPPEELWRRPVGAGWSAFAASQGLAVTQEQRGVYELVVAYRLTDGEVAWSHADGTRFDPLGPMKAMGGVGPRATPAIFDGLVVTQGANGLLNCLDLATGEVRWSRTSTKSTACPT